MVNSIAINQHERCWVYNVMSGEPRFGNGDFGGGIDIGMFGFEYDGEEGE